MAELEDNNIDLETDGSEKHPEHHRRHHKHRIRVKQKVKVKKSNTRIKKKAQKVLNFVIWTTLIVLFIISIILLISELDKIGVTKDRRNKTSELINNGNSTLIYHSFKPNTMIF